MILDATTKKVQLVTSAAVTVDVFATWFDHAAGVVTPGSTPTAITTATTTDIVAAPAASTQRNISEIMIRNKHASTSVDVTVLIDVSATDYELYKTTLRAGETLEYKDGLGFFLAAPANAGALLNYNTSDQSVAAATTAYIVGTAITFPAARPIRAGSLFTWEFSITKTAAGTASSSFLVKFGTLGTTGDATILTFATGTATAAVDTATVIIRAQMRGPIGASSILEGNMSLSHNLAATGFSNLPTLSVNATSAGFNCTTDNIISGVTVTTGASSVWNFELVNCEVAGA